jgi:hypothetical protein
MRRWLGLAASGAAGLAAAILLLAAASGAGAADEGWAPPAEATPEIGPLTPLEVPPDEEGTAQMTAGAAIVTPTTKSLLLIPDSANNRVMAFDPLTGDLINANFIPSDTTHLSTPKNAILNAAGDRVLVSDQTEDLVLAYTLNGAYAGVFAPAGGVNTAILDNILGIALRPNGNLLVTVIGGTNANAVAEFNTAGTYLGNFVANGSGGLDGPFDILARGTSDWLVTGINSNDLRRYNFTTGAHLGALAAVDQFPQQVALAGNGNVLVANFDGTQEGIVEFTAGGALVGVYTATGLSNYRGVHELPGGSLLVATDTGVYEINRADQLVDTKLVTVSAQYIERVAIPVSISLEKTVGLNPNACATAHSVTVLPGTEVTYCYSVRNTGQVALTRHNLNDSALGVVLNSFIYSLAPGASAFLTQSVLITTTTLNTATWTAYNPGPVDVAAAMDTALATAGGVTLVKTVGLNPHACAPTHVISLTVGLTVTYCYSVRNDSPVTFTRHTVTDSQFGTLLNGLVYTLTPGAGAFFTKSAFISTTTTNTAAWVSFNPGPIQVVTGTDSARVSLLKFRWLPIVLR